MSGVVSPPTAFDACHSDADALQIDAAYATPIASETTLRVLAENAGSKSLFGNRASRKGPSASNPKCFRRSCLTPGCHARQVLLSGRFAWKKKLSAAAREAHLTRLEGIMSVIRASGFGVMKSRFDFATAGARWWVRGGRKFQYTRHLAMISLFTSYHARFSAAQPLPSRSSQI